MSDLQLLFNADQGQDEADIIPSLDRSLKQTYPGLQTRWSRVYGRRRWAHIYGSVDFFSLNPLRIELGPNYGLYIDNPELIPPNDLDRLIDLLQNALVLK